MNDWYNDGNSVSRFTNQIFGGLYKVCAFLRVVVAASIILSNRELDHTDIASGVIVLNYVTMAKDVLQST